MEVKRGSASGITQDEVALLKEILGVLTAWPMPKYIYLHSGLARSADGEATVFTSNIHCLIIRATVFTDKISEAFECTELRSCNQRGVGVGGAQALDLQYALVCAPCWLMGTANAIGLAWHPARVRGVSSVHVTSHETAIPCADGSQSSCRSMVVSMERNYRKSQIS